MTFGTEGAEQLRRVASALKDAGDTGLMRAVGAAQRDEAKPLGLRVLRRGAREMPKRGGLAARVGASSAGVTSTVSGRVASSTVALRNTGVDLKSLDAGTLRHKVFGNPEVWVRQSVPPGAFRRAFDAEAADVSRKALKAAQGVLDDVARKA